MQILKETQKKKLSTTNKRIIVHMHVMLHNAFAG